MDIQKKFERAFQKAEVLTRNQGQKRTVYKEVNLSHDGQRHVLSYIVEKEKDITDAYWLSFSSRNRLNGQRVTISEIDKDLSINDNVDLDALLAILEDRVKIDNTDKKLTYSSYR
jgi:hypothetical protein